MLYWYNFVKQFRKHRHENRELVIAALIFSTAFVCFNAIMVVIEKLDLFSSIYFSFVTAATVGYGDISPRTSLGRGITIVYMLVSIGALGTAIGVTTAKVTDIFSKKKRGLLTVKNDLDLLIIGYPNETKVKNIVKEFRLDPRFAAAAIAVVTDKLEERPAWMATEDVFFVKGLASKKDVLEQANIAAAQRVLVLAEDPFNEIADEYSSSAVIMSERLNPAAYTVAEKVREDGYLFEVVGCDLVVSVSRAGELVQELQNPGAIEFAECIFSNQTKGNQYNMLLEHELPWREIVLAFLAQNATAIGFKNPAACSFCFTPHASDLVQRGAVVKYLSEQQLSALEPGGR